jgi:hypothetical protein
MGEDGVELADVLTQQPRLAEPAERIDAVVGGCCQAVVDSLVERGLASTFRADGDRTATL